MNEIVKSFSASLEELCDNLYVVSETDAPLKAIEWKKINTLDESTVATKLKQAPEFPLEKISFDDFFLNKITPKDWHGDAEKAALAKFVALKDFLAQNLSDLIVYKTTSAAKKDVVILGKNAEGFYAGLKTYVVET